eukprot:317066-Chlamydomonas_euryale.AAC.5
MRIGCQAAGVCYRAGGGGEYGRQAMVQEAGQGCLTPQLMLLAGWAGWYRLVQAHAEWNPSREMDV